jgi:hypothetical protein
MNSGITDAMLLGISKGYVERNMRPYIHARGEKSGNGKERRSRGKRDTRRKESHSRAKEKKEEHGGHAATSSQQESPITKSYSPKPVDVREEDNGMLYSVPVEEYTEGLSS